jgi:hypothetical protein
MLADVLAAAPDTLGTEYEADGQALVRRFEGYVVATVADCQQAVNDRQEVATRIAKVRAFFAPMKTAAHALHKAICARENAVVGPFEQVDAGLRKGIQAFTQAEQQRIRAEEQRLAEERRREDQARVLAEAAALEQAGESAMAEAVVEQAIAAPVTTVVLPTVKSQVVGLKTRTEYGFRITNEKLIPREYMTVDEKKIGAVARAMKCTTTVPGIEFYSSEVPVR